MGLNWDGLNSSWVGDKPRLQYGAHRQRGRSSRASEAPAGQQPREGDTDMDDVQAPSPSDTDDGKQAQGANKTRWRIALLCSVPPF